MSAPSDPPAGEPSSDGDRSAAAGSPRSRRLRAKRAAPPLRLIESGEGGGGTSGIGLELSGDRPLAFMRLGGQDLEAGMRAISAERRPTAVVTGLGESRETTSRARRLARAGEVPWLVDPLLFRTGLEGYRTPSALHDLDYTPGRDGDPYAPADFDDGAVASWVGRSCIGTQLDLLAAGAIGGAFVVSRIDDPWLAVNQRLLRIATEATATWNVPVIAALPIRMLGFEHVESQRLLVRALMARRPDAWLLMADGLSADSSVGRVVATLRLALALQAASAPVILARAGDLRRLAWSLGIAGAEFGLGRLLRFEVPDFIKATRGPGPTPGPRMEMSSLGCSLGFSQARRALAGELVSEADCECSACAEAESLDVRMARVAEHNAHTVLAEVAALASRTPTERVADLDGVLQLAWQRSAWLDYDQPATRLRARIDHQRRILEAAMQAGLHDPARVVEQLRLFD